MSTFWTGKIIDALGEWTEETTGENHVQTAVDRVHSSGARAVESGSRAADQAATLLRDGALLRQTADTAETVGTVSKASNGVELAMRATFVKQVAKMCGKAGAAGAAVDGAIGGFRAAKHLQDGTIDDSYDPIELAVLIWSSTRGITTVSHMKHDGYHFKMLDEMKVPAETLFEHFLKLIGTGIATEKARKEGMTDSHNIETSVE